MFNSISGTITGKFPKQLFIETNGIEWDLCVPDSCLEEWPAVGNNAKAYVYLNHYENGMDLYGFATNEERTLFFDLLKVDGVGPKAALKIMSNIKVQELISVLESGELAVLEKIPGVGKKTAAKMMLALKGKLTIPEETVIRVEKKSEYSIVITSLIEMGYEKSECEQCVSSLVQKFSSDSTFASKNKQEKEDAIFRAAILELSV